MPAPPLSVVVPLYNERDNLEPLCAEIERALDGRIDYELVLVDDGSSDGSDEVLAVLSRDRPRLRVVSHQRNLGQSAALCTGIRAARGELIATLDGDLQNDPADIPRLLAELRAAPAGVERMIAGNRIRRRDGWLRRVSSRVANAVRAAVLADGCPDTGCSLKLFRRERFLELPQFDHMHRFLPALFADRGVEVVNVAVGHRPRRAGRSKYGLGNRLMVGIVDLLGVRWLIKRSIHQRAARRRQPDRDHD